MTSNVGILDRGIRMLLGIILIALGVTHIVTGTSALIAYVVAAIALLTGLARFCPAWFLFGINTCPLKAKDSK